MVDVNVLHRQVMVMVHMGHILLLCVVDVEVRSLLLENKLSEALVLVVVELHILGGRCRIFFTVRPFTARAITNAIAALCLFRINGGVLLAIH